MLEGSFLNKRGGLFMINVIKSLDYLEESSSHYYKIMDCEAFFLGRVTYKEFSDEDLAVLREIDKADMLDISTGAIKTKYGVTNVDNLSTGCKTVLVYLYTRKHLDEDAFRNGILLNVTECGGNALRVLFDLADKHEDDTTIFLLSHNDGVGLCDGHKYLINNKIESGYPCG